MMQLEFGGRRYEIPAGELAVGSDPSCEVTLTGEGIAPRHALVRGTSSGGAVIQRGSANSETRVNGVRLGAEPSPILHGDKIQIGAEELLVVDSQKSGSTQFFDASALSGMAASAPSKSRGAGPAPVSGGRLVCLTDGREYTIEEILVFGREAGSDVVVENTQVSRCHAEIKATPEGYVLTDLSTNGTYVNGQRVEGSRTLARADMIRVADNEFRFYADALPAAPASPTSPPPEAASSSGPLPPTDEPLEGRTPPSKMMSSGPVVPPAGASHRLNDTLHGQSFRPSSGTTPQATPVESRNVSSPPMASLLIRSGKLKGTRIPVRVPIVNIGRADYNDIILADDSVSTAHAKLQRREGVWTLVDLGSTNGTFVDGEPVTGEVPLGPGVTVRFGQLSVLFEPTDDALGVAKGSGTRMMAPVQAPEPKIAPPPVAPVAPTPPRPSPASPPREQPVRPATRRPVIVTTPTQSSSRKWVLPALVALALAAVIYFLLQR